MADLGWVATPLSSSSTVLDVAQGWFEQLEHRVRQGQRDRHTLNCYRRDILACSGDLGERAVDAVRPPDVIAWHDALCERHTSARAFAAYQSLRALFSFARRRGLIHDNPAVRLEISHTAAPPRPLTPEEVIRWRAGLDQLEAQRRAVASRRDLEPMRLLGLLSVFGALRLLELTGRRLSEICGVAIEAVQLKSRCILLERTKTGPSAVPLAPQAVALIEAQLRWVDGRSRWLFPSATVRDAHVGPNAVWETFHRACGLAGLSGRHPHDLRHAWVWTALVNGASWDDVSGGCGHRSVATTKRVYARGMLLFPGMFTAARLVEDARKDGVQ